MDKRLEAEKKYYCINSDDLMDKINTLGFKLIKSGTEMDEYFTDIDSEYIRNRTCLRIRITNNEDMEITFKGRSRDFTNTFAKLESNFKMDKSNYENFKNLFSAIGYYSYTIVNKERYTYQMKDENVIYNIMFDSIEDLGGFVEFEILYNDFNTPEEEIYNKLNKFVSLFDSLNLEEANLPYRDFVAIKLYEDYKPKKEIKGIHLNLDTFLKTYEKEFYEFYKKVMKIEFNTSLKWKAFKDDIYNAMINPDVKRKFDTYFDNLKIQDSKFILLFELLKQLKEKGLDIILSTNCNETFVNNLLSKVFNDNTINKVIYLNNNKAIYSEIKKNGLDLVNYFNITKLNLEQTNSLLLVIINNLV